MNPVKLIRIVVLISFFTDVHSKILPDCDMKNCKDYTKLIEHKVKKPNIEITKTRVKITEGLQKIDLIYVKRRRLRIYCYDGSSIDSNTGCFENIDLVNPNCVMAKEWNKQGKCPTGWECCPDVDCIGSDATQKCFDKTTMTTNKVPQVLKWEATRYMLFPKHTCVSSWECNIFTNSVDMFAKFEQSGELVWVIYTKDNKEIEINKGLIELGIENNLGEKLCIDQEYTEPTLHLEDAEYYAESINNIKCIVKGSGIFKGTVFDVSQSGEGVLRNLVFEIVGPLMVPNEGKISNLMDNKVQGMPSTPTYLEDRQRAVNVETAHELAINAIVLQMQTLYNVLSLAQEMEEIYNAFLILVKSQSIDDPLLISYILKGHKFASSDLNKMIESYELP